LHILGWLSIPDDEGMEWLEGFLHLLSVFLGGGQKGIGHGVEFVN